MSDPIEQFECILKKQCLSKPLGLYNGNNKQNTINYKPQDVLLSVASQMKAIQVADSVKSEKCVKRDINRFKKTSFLSVNMLPVYDEVPKQTAKFDTQCVTDTQLINLIEDAEIIDVHRGMTQEFETTFCHHTEEYERTEEVDKEEKICTEVSRSKDDPIKHITKINDCRVTNIDMDNSISLISPIMRSNKLENKHTNFDENTGNIDTGPNTQDCATITKVDIFSPSLNNCIEIKEEADIERPLSPIFMHKHVKTKSKSPSPLIFSLDKFEKFEQIAMPILEVNDLKTAKQVINSQILDSELQIKINEEIFLDDKNDTSLVNHSKHEVQSLNAEGELKSHIDLEFIELDNSTSKDLINKVMTGNLNENPSEVLKDEILFSSDEDDNYVHKEYQDLPFTCALETSFYDRSDVLDKTMFVGFQTASNKTIQIFTESFAQAKSILNDVTSDKVTITDLVKQCESHTDNKTQDKHQEEVKMDSDTEVIKSNLAPQDDRDAVIKPDREPSGNINKESLNKDVALNRNVSKDNLDCKPIIKSNFQGFMTASNKNIKLSENALARCNKVFQDIDLSEDFDTEKEGKVSLEEDKETAIKKDNKEQKVTSNISKTKVNDDCVDVEMQTIDDVIMQEFENIEMSLEEDKEVEKTIAPIDNETEIRSDIKTEDKREKIEDIIEDIDFDNDFSQITACEILPEQTKKTSQKNVNYTKLDSPKGTSGPFTKTSEGIDEIIGHTDYLNLPSTSTAGFVGFKTANNKNINISRQALAKTMDIFKDIDAQDFKLSKEKIEDKDNQLEQPRKSLEGFKTASNKNIKISKDALAKTINIFKDIETTDFKLLINANKDLFENNTSKYPAEFIDINQPSTSKTNFAGFKTANNKEIKISIEALTKTRDVFKDIDADSEIADENTVFGKERKGIENKWPDYPTDIHPNTQLPVPSIFKGFKTASNKNIKISESALAKTKDLFKDIESDNNDFGPKIMKEDILVDNNSTPQNKITQNRSLKTDLENFKAVTEFDRKQHLKTKQRDLIQGSSPHKVSKSSKTMESTEYMDNVEKNYTNSPGEIDLNESFTKKARFVGFKTANNKNINITKESIAKTRNIFKDIDTDDFTFSKKTKAQKTDKDKGIYPILEDKPSLTNPDFIGFKTGNNKAIRVSEKALAATKKIFKDIDTDCEINKKEKDEYPTIIKESNAIECNNDIETRNNPVAESIPKFQGFTTASNKKVKISEDALIRSRDIFKGIDKTDYCIDKRHSKEFSDKYSEYNKAESILQISETNLQNGKSSPVFRGFQTANKKSVTVSKEALAKSKEFFKDLDASCIEMESAFRGFKTANDNKVEISEKALTETKKLFENVATSSFKGFQTASDKKVVISEDALAKSRKLFQDIDLKSQNNEHSGIVEKKTTNINYGFKTGRNKDVIISEEAVAKTKRLFSDIDNPKSTKYNEEKKAKEDGENIIDTQVINSFDDSLHTEDFHDTPVKSKRSGSPILSCPKAKRRKKFETPYNTQRKHISVLKTENIINNANKITFTENYKANKCFSLKDLQKFTTNCYDDDKIDSYLRKFNFDNLLTFEFHDNRNCLSPNNMTIESLKEIFLNAVNKKLIPDGWLDNHLKLILWKLISYEIKYDSIIVCNARNVIDQLKYRYDRELYNAQRPALRKILEKDDVASKTIVLCVAGIYVDGVSVASASTMNNLELLVTDGWYCVKATIDKMLAQLVCDGKIGVGTKIVTNGAELLNCEQGVSPWEDTSAVRLKLFGNSTRRARWDARLGYHGNGAILSQLSSVKLDGGKVSKLRMFVTRVYPAMYVEKFDDGSTVTRSERLEHLHQMKTDAERQATMEKIYEEVEKEFSDQGSQDSEGLSDSCGKRTYLDSGSQIAKVMKGSRDPAEFRAQLTSSQSKLLEDHTSKRRDRLLEDIQKRIGDKVEKARVCVNRNVVTLLKIRVAGVRERGGVEITKGMMSIWKPADALLEIIKEGAWVDVMNVMPTAVRYSEIQMSAGRQSVFSTSKYKEPEKCKPYTALLKRKCFTIKDLAQNPAIATDYNEIDTVGFIFLIDPSIEEFESTKQSFQNVYLVDADKNMICVNFWGGLKKFGFHNVLDTGQVTTCVNLQKRAGNTRKTIPQYRVTEFSYFTKSPKNETARTILDDLNKKFISLDRRKFCEDCAILKNNYAVTKTNNENVSPYRFYNDYNISRNKVFIDSPLAQPNRIDDNFNLTGLDFESTFKQDTQNLPEEVLIRKRKVNEKIARLKMYGEPPPLYNMHIINKSESASNSYKSPILPQNETQIPLNSKSDSSNVASAKDSPEKWGNLNDGNSSPVILNRTYVKSIDPVKIYFDASDINDSNLDHFAEEFDGSPPLSLD